MAELDEVAQIISEAEQATAVGDYVAAERALRRALKLQEARLGLVHSDVANTLNDLGVVCDILGRPDEAEYLYRRALGIARKTLSADHPYIATSLQNLSNLYRAQGKPEKLAKVVEGRSHRSGLPGIDLADGSGAETAASEEVAHPEAPAVPSPIAHPQSGGSPLSRPHPLSGRFAQPAILFAGTGVVLLSTLWLLFGGSVGSDAPEEEGAGVGASLRSPSGEREAVGPDRAGGSVSTAASLVPDADDIATATDSDGAHLTTPSPEDRLAPTTEPSGTRSPTAVETPSVVVDADVCTRLVTRSADGALLAEWPCQPVVDRAAPGQLFFYTRIRSETSTTVEHRWFRNGVLEQAIDLSVGANSGPGYRTYSVRTVSPQENGAWRVELRSMDEEVLYTEEFVVR